MVIKQNVNITRLLVISDCDVAEEKKSRFKIFPTPTRIGIGLIPPFFSLFVRTISQKPMAYKCSTTSPEMYFIRILAIYDYSCMVLLSFSVQSLSILHYGRCHIFVI